MLGSFVIKKPNITRARFLQKNPVLIIICNRPVIFGRSCGLLKPVLFSALQENIMTEPQPSNSGNFGGGAFSEGIDFAIRGHEMQFVELELDQGEKRRGRSRQHDVQVELGRDENHLR